LPDLRAKLNVKVEPTKIGGVPAFIVTPDAIPEANRNRLLFHVHGGGYVLFPGESGTREAILAAHYGKFRVISVDYRMPPDHPYPAAMDDAMAVWKEVVKTTNPKNIAIFGTSTGGGMTLAMVLRAKKEGLPLPAATAPGTPWSDMTKTGDTFFTNEMVDNILVSNDGWLGDAARLYAAGTDLKDPQLSPVYGDYRRLPADHPDLGHARPVPVQHGAGASQAAPGRHRVGPARVRGAVARAVYAGDPFAPETREHFGELTAFFDRHLEK
jgi:acetyl esterase/lipase